MAGVYQLQIVETLNELKKLLRVKKAASDKERIQLLYLLKSEQATNYNYGSQSFKKTSSNRTEMASVDIEKAE